MSMTIQQAFEQYHAANPNVYRWLVSQARRAKALGYTRIGIDLLFCVLRWQRMMETKDPSQDTFRINDHYRSRYARLIMEREQGLEGIFTTRRLTSTGPNPLYGEEPKQTEALF